MPGTVKHILMVDDDPDDQQLFKIALEENYPECLLTTANDREALFKMLDENPVPDLIVIDINLPLISGRECLQQIRSNKEYDGVMVVMLSSYQNPAVIDDCLKLGAMKYYVKPTTYVEIKQVVDEICSLY